MTEETAITAPDCRPIRMGVLDDFVGMLLRVAYEESFDDFSRLLGSDTLKPGYFTILTLIAKNPGITQVEIGKAAGRDKSSVTKALRNMEDQGLITRVRGEDDRRSYGSYLTESGAELQQRMEDKAKTHIARLDAVIGSDRKAILLEILRDIIHGLPRYNAQDR
ncbi:MarR family transcriptional regulator [Rhodobacteraceae bacterium WD3A24]|nr:MarR family transcriptional regulator [Rhodobacteraceae bacterium WD3A24]